MLALFPILLVQNALGLLLAKLLGLHPVFGLIAGSITLVGGHGTGAAYAERFAAEHDLLGVMGLTMTSATIGLVLGRHHRRTGRRAADAPRWRPRLPPSSRGRPPMASCRAQASPCRRSCDA